MVDKFLAKAGVELLCPIVCKVKDSVIEKPYHTQKKLIYARQRTKNHKKALLFLNCHFNLFIKNRIENP